LTFALSVANHAEAQRLKKMVVSGQQHAAELEARLEEQACAIDTLNNSVSELELESSFHREQAARLRHDLDANTSLLQRSLAQQRADRAANEAIVREQQVLLERLYNRKIHHDAIVDGGIAALSLWACV
jgi:hypothetical protein